MAKKKIINRPSSFEYENFIWKINYLNTENDDHGQTYSDLKIINIYIKNKDEQVIKDTLLHEVLHSCLENIISIITKIPESSDDIEEHLVRLLTPRVHVVFSKNKELRDYIFAWQLLFILI